MYLKGGGVKRDRAQALAWFDIALTGNQEDMAPHRREIVRVRDKTAAEMTASDMAQARQIEKGWADWTSSRLY